MKNNNIFKRICAYLIDFLVITIISSGITYISFINPKYEEYRELSDKYNDVLASYYEGEIEISELSTKTHEMSYDINKLGYVYLIGDIVIIIIYFGGFAYITKGQTLGKKIMGIKIVSAKDKELNIFNYVIRALILNGVIMNVITLVALAFTRNTYYKIYDIGSNLDTILLVIILLMIFFYKEQRGLHDVIAGTKVIDLKKQNEEDKEEKKIDTKKEKVKNE